MLGYLVLGMAKLELQVAHSNLVDLLHLKIYGLQQGETVLEEVRRNFDQLYIGTSWRNQELVLL